MLMFDPPELSLLCDFVRFPCWPGRDGARSGSAGDGEWHRVKGADGSSVTACTGVDQVARARAFQNGVPRHDVVVASTSAGRVQVHARLCGVEDRVARNCIVVVASIDGIKGRRAKDFIASDGDAIPKASGGGD